MKILVVAPWGEALGGAETMLLALLDHSATSGVEYEVVFLHDGPFVDESRRRGAGTWVVEAGRLRLAHRFARTIRELARIIDATGPDVVLAWSPKTHLYAAPAAARARHRASLVWWQHGVPDGHWLDSLATALPADAVGCSSRAAAAAQAQKRPRRRTFVVHPGIDLPAAHDGLGIRERLGVAQDALVIGIVGRLQPWKGQDRFVRALALLRARGHHVVGLVVGGDAYGLSPDYARDLEALIDSLGMRPHLRMTGQVDDALPYVQAMDVLVNASETEPFGIVLLEAMASAVPVVAVGRGGPTEIVEPGRSGVLVDSGSPEHLAGGLEALVADAALRRHLAAGSRQAYLESFSAATMAETLGRELRSVIRG
jgi:glycosyltransferase involved in cell wall biosynthesis